MSDKISGYPVPDLADLPEDVRNQILEVQEKAGFVPNVFLGLAYRPAEFRAFFAYYDALMGKESGLSQADREMIIVASSAINKCQYCVVAHGAVLRVRAKDPLIADKVAVNYKKADLAPREFAMVEFACKVTTNSHDVNEADYAVLRDVGFSDDDIWDIGAITAFFGMSNRLANTFDMRPNVEFFSMGR